jgi:hypothetical protein
MRQLIPCKINIQKAIQDTLQHQNEINNDNFNFDSNGKLPIVLNNQPIGYIVNANDSVLWLDITPEFMMIDDKWNLSALNINIKNNEDKFNLEYEFVNGSKITTIPCDESKIIRGKGRGINFNNYL